MRNGHNLTHPVLELLGCVCSALLGPVERQRVDDADEVQIRIGDCKQT